jgi:hypothetical protein
LRTAAYVAVDLDRPLASGDFPSFFTLLPRASKIIQMVCEIFSLPSGTSRREGEKKCSCAWRAINVQEMHERRSFFAFGLITFVGL